MHSYVSFSFYNYLISAFKDSSNSSSKTHFVPMPVQNTVASVLLPESNAVLFNMLPCTTIIFLFYYRLERVSQGNSCFFLSDCGSIITFIREGVCLSVTLAFRAFCNSSGVLTKYPLPPKADIIFS